jgi:IPT/TIG domain-containing protein
MREGRSGLASKMVHGSERAGGRIRRPLARVAAILVAQCMLMLGLLAEPSLLTSAHAQNDPSLVTFNVRDRSSGDTLDSLGVEWRWIVNEDNTHSWPDHQPSLENPTTYAPLVDWGDNTSPTTSALPPGKYLVTVEGGPFPAVPGDEGYKMWGAHFTVDGSGAPMTVQVSLVPNPLPLGSIKAQVFHDNAVLNGEPDLNEEGLKGYEVVVYDQGGAQVIVDIYNNPICGKYDQNGDPIPGTGGTCTTNSKGVARIPNMGPAKYEVEVIPPDAAKRGIQTSTIEGKREQDNWTIEGDEGNNSEGPDPEGNVPIAQVWFGFVAECTFGDATDDCPDNNTAGNGTITGQVVELKDTFDGLPAEYGNPVPRAYLGLTDLGLANDKQVWTGAPDQNGNFTIEDVPNGLYQLAVWDDPDQDYIIQFYTVRVNNGETVNLGKVGMPRWFGTIRGYAYADTGVAVDGWVFSNGRGNGIRNCHPAGGVIDPHDVSTCEPPIAGQDFDIRQKDGSVIAATVADKNGYYEFPEYFEWEHFLIWEIGYGRGKQVGTAAYYTDDYGEPLDYPSGPVHTSEGLASLLQSELTPAGSTLWIDSGKLPHPTGENGGVVGIVFYGTTRNEFDPAVAVNEDYEPGIPGVPVNLYSPLVDQNGDPVIDPDGSYAKDRILGTYATDSFYDTRPGTDGDACQIPPYPNNPNPPDDPNCTELPRTFVQDRDGVFDGGYAFTGDCSDPNLQDPEGDDDGDGVINGQDPDLLLDGDCLEAGLQPDNYIVEVDPSPGYRVITESDQNTDQGDDFVPQLPPPDCTGPLHTVHDDRNPADGTDQPLCNSRRVTVSGGFNAEANFWLMTGTGVPSSDPDNPDPDFYENAVPIPGRIRGVLLDDLNIDLDPSSMGYLEKAGIPHAPVSIQDYAGNEITRVYTDDLGFWEVLLPSTYTAFCPIPQGICPGMYKVIGNHPVRPDGTVDPNWNPLFSTLPLQFEVWPGKTTYADVAILPSALASAPCDVAAGTPDVQSVSRPWVTGSARNFTIRGSGFGATQGSGSVTLDGTPLTIRSWGDTSIGVAVPNSVPRGAHQLLVTSGTAKTSPEGITIHFTGTGYNPKLLHVGSGQTYSTIQAAIDAAPNPTTKTSIVIVHPGTYVENVVMGKALKLQGYGPGVTTINGAAFDFAEFDAKVGSTPHDGADPVPSGQTITVLARNRRFGSGFRAQIDGFRITGGTRATQPGQVNTGGGGIYAHAFARFLTVSNNLIEGNNGSRGGGIILGQPLVPNPDSGNALDNQNDSIRIHHNRVRKNGGLILAGGVAIYNGATDYEIDHNAVCGNYSAEYGAGISHRGLSDGGRIHENEVRFNAAFDEGGGIMLAGEVPADGSDPLGPGTGAVDIERNLVQENISNDDGGGIRLMDPLDWAINIDNNMIVNNVATDTGGGIAMEDGFEVAIVNNTIAKNISTATAEDADRSTCRPASPLGTCPHGAGLFSEPNSLEAMQEYNPPADFSQPVALFNNIFWQNQAYYWRGDSSDLTLRGSWDLETWPTPSPECFDPRYSIVTVEPDPAGCSVDGSNLVGSNPAFADPYDTQLATGFFSGDPSFIEVQLIFDGQELLADYHIGGTSPAIDAGVASLGGVHAPLDDFDGDARPQGGGYDSGADEAA